MPAIQSAKLQGVLQSQALRICSKRQDLPEEEKTQAEAEKSARIDARQHQSEKGCSSTPLFLCPLFSTNTVSNRPDYPELIK